MAESTGLRLKKLRLEKGISLEEVHKKTKIHLNILKAIEEDSLINFSPVYIRGFLKLYCKFLGTDPKDYIIDYKEPRAKLEPIAGPEQKHGSIFKPAFFKFKHIKILKTVLIIILLLIFIVGLFKLGKAVSKKRTSLHKKAKSSSVASVKIDKKNVPVKADKSQKAVVKPAEQSSETIPKTGTSLGIRLTILTRENCFIQVKVDGKVLFQGSLIKGRSESWQAKEKIELSLGNAGVVDLEINGKLFSGLGKKGQSLKNILITKDGLNVRR